MTPVVATVCKYVSALVLYVTLHLLREYAHLLAPFISKILSGVGIGSGTASTTGMSSLVERPSTSPSAEGMSDVCGVEVVKKELVRAVVLPLLYPNVFFDPSAPSLRPPSGVLLHGPPGTGKTLLARACASESGASFLPLTASSLESKWFGEAPKLIREAFLVARRVAPCVVFLDEVDGMGRARSGEDQSCVYSFKCELLRNLDTVTRVDEKGKVPPVVVIACTNRPDSLDEALRRRLSLSLEVGRPSKEGREEILAREFRKGGEKLSRKVVRSVALKMEGMSGSEVSDAAKRAAAKRVWERMGEKSENETKAFLSSLSDGKSLLRALGPACERHFIFSPPH